MERREWIVYPRRKKRKQALGLTASGLFLHAEKEDRKQKELDEQPDQF